MDEGTNPYADLDSTAPSDQPTAAPVRWYERRTLWALLGVIVFLWVLSDVIIQKLRLWAMQIQEEFLL